METRSIVRRLLGCVLFGACTVLAGPVQLTPLSPPDGAKVSMLSPVQQLFCHLTAQGGGEALAGDSLLCDELVAMKSFPKGIELSWLLGEAGVDVRYDVMVSEDEAFGAVRVLGTQEQRLTLYNLLPGKMYWWKVAAVYSDGRRLESPARSFVVDDSTPRILYVPNVPNVRDIGGFVGLEGRRMPYGLVYRSAQFNLASGGGKTPGRPWITAEGIERVRNELHLKTELDLRGDDETGGMTASPAGADIAYVNCSVWAYASFFKPGGMERAASAFRVFLNPANYPIDIHCVGGADRTASLAFLLENLLGADEETVCRDYVLTSFFTPRGYSTVKGLFQYLDAFGTADESRVAKAERYLFAIGFTADDIEAFRAFILGPGLAETAGCAQQRQIASLLASFPKPAHGLDVIPFQPFGATMKMDGQDVRPPMDEWTASPVAQAVMDDDGAFAFHLFNHDIDHVTHTVQLKLSEPLLAEKYTIIDALNRIVFAQEDGQTEWSPKSLETFAMELPVGVNVVLVVAPAALPSDFTVVPAVVPRTDSREGVFVVPSGSAPILDGLLDDDIWSIMPPLECVDRMGHALERAPLVHLRTDEAHETLFIGVDVKDVTFCGTDHGDLRDVALNEEDDVEIFLGSIGAKTYYHFMFNRFGNVWDARLPEIDTHWNAAACSCACRQNDEGWTAEIALPFSNFTFSALPEINVCFSDNPAENYAVLFPTGKWFSNRSSMRTAVLK